MPGHPNLQEILETAFDAVSDETIDELNKLTPILLSYYVGKNGPDQNTGEIKNVIIQSSDPVKYGFNFINTFYYKPVENQHADIPALKAAIETGDINAMVKLLRKHSEQTGDQDIRRISSIILEHQINTLLKKPTFGASVMVQNVAQRMIDGDHIIDRIKFQILIEYMEGNKIYYNEQIVEIDKEEFMENPLKLAEHAALDNPGIRSADGSGIEFHRQLFGPFAELVCS